jgi:hypothetical protein
MIEKAQALKNKNLEIPKGNMSCYNSFNILSGPEIQNDATIAGVKVGRNDIEADKTINYIQSVDENRNTDFLNQCSHQDCECSRKGNDKVDFLENSSKVDQRVDLKIMVL